MSNSLIQKYELAKHQGLLANAQDLLPSVCREEQSYQFHYELAELAYLDADLNQTVFEAKISIHCEQKRLDAILLLAEAYAFLDGEDNRKQSFFWLNQFLIEVTSREFAQYKKRYYHIVLYMINLFGVRFPFDVLQSHYKLLAQYVFNHVRKLTYYDINVKGKRAPLVVCGAGNYAIYLYEMLKRSYDIICFVDQDVEKQKTLLYGRPIVGYEVLSKLESVPVVISTVLYYDEIFQLLKRYGIKNVKTITLQ